MKTILTNIILKSDAEKFLIYENDSVDHKIAYGMPEDVSKVLDEILKVTESKPHPEAYWRVEECTLGHKWHKDTGDGDHMTWCTYGSSTLLTEGFKDGRLKYRIDGKETAIENRKVGDTYIHSSDVEHMVEPHTGRRSVLLFFI